MKKVILIYFLLPGLMLSSMSCRHLSGKKHDADGDGIIDKRDKCSNTPKGAFVDRAGCILDVDKDGIADNLDGCPAVYGIARFNGCPDTDKDGVEDKYDRCIDLAGSAALEGCPDTDGDGIEDNKDKCPKVSGVAAFEGCPDTDGDGVPDAIDQCITVKGAAKFEGCPDTDGDGIQENLDKCPTLAGVAANNGCPEIKASVIQLLTKVSAGIGFNKGKATLSNNSSKMLDQVIGMLNQHTVYRIHIGVVEDKTADSDKNKTMAKEKAMAIEKYLQSKGIGSERITTETIANEKRVTKNNVEFSIWFEGNKK